MPFMAIEKFILDENDKEQRERMLRRRLTDAEHGTEAKDIPKLQEILGDPMQEKLFGELLHTMYGDEALGLFERLGSQTATMEDLRKVNQARFEFRDRLSKAEILRARLKDEDIGYLSKTNDDFNAVAGLLKDDKRTAEIIRDHFYRMAMKGETDTMLEIDEAQQKLRAVRGSKEYLYIESLAHELKDKYGFSDKDYSILEEGHYTLKERKNLKHQIYQNFSGYMKTLNFLDNVFTLGLTSPASRRTNKAIDADFKETKEMMKAHFRQQGYGAIRSFFRSAKALNIVGKIEDAKTPAGLKEQFETIGGILAASLSSDNVLLQELVREAKGGEKAEATDKTKPMTFAELKNNEAQLNETNYKNAFKDYLKTRRTEGLNTAGLGHAEKDAEIQRFHQQYGQQRRPGFFMGLLTGLMRLFSNENKNLLKDNALWA